jgi:hypothetical protein
VIHSKHCGGKKVERVCPKCGFIIKTCYDRHVNYCTGKGPRRTIVRHQGGKRWLTGKTYEEGYGENVAEKMKKKISQKLKGHHNWDKVPKEDKEYLRERSRQLILKRYEQGWLPKAGRCKKIAYDSKSCGIVKLDGSWELCVAIYLDDKNISWNNDSISFPFTGSAPDIGAMEYQNYSLPLIYKTGDLNKDNQVNLEDIKLLMENWSSQNLLYDLNRDNKIDLLDIMIIINNWS